MSIERPATVERARTPTGLELIEAKLLPPRDQRGRVPRSRLLRRLRAARERLLVTIIAPAGYGKSSLLTQLASVDPRPTAWLTVDALDNDPATFLSQLERKAHPMRSTRGASPCCASARR